MTKKTLKKYFLFLSLFLIFIVNDWALAYSENYTDLTLELPDQEISLSKENINQWIITEPSLIYSPDYHSQIENTDFCNISLIICALTNTEQIKFSTKKIEVRSFKKEAVRVYLEDLARRFNKEPTDAKFAIENDKVSDFSLSQDGYQIDIDNSLTNIIDFLSKKNNEDSLKLPYQVVEPEIKSGQADKLGIKTLIGEGHSNFTGSTLSRIHNIKIATSRFDGLIIKPGEEFSFVKNLGGVDGEHGYKQELVIKKGVTEPEFGGGVCQVSTTAFRAAIYSGLEITARRNHAYAVHYYAPHGMDSTIYIPNPDLRFKNNTTGYILIKTELDLEKKELIFKFYGTDDGRKTEVDGPHILSKEPDGSMKTTFNQKVTTASGEILIDNDFNSSYNSPNDYPRPGEVLISKPDNWSSKEWKEYQKDNGA